MKPSTQNRITSLMAAIIVACFVIAAFIGIAWVMDATFDVSKSTTMFVLLIANTVWLLYGIAED